MPGDHNRKLVSIFISVLKPRDAYYWIRLAIMTMRCSTDSNFWENVCAVGHLTLSWIIICMQYSQMTRFFIIESEHEVDNVILFDTIANFQCAWECVNCVKYIQQLLTVHIDWTYRRKCTMHGKCSPCIDYIFGGSVACRMGFRCIYFYIFKMYIY